MERRRDAGPALPLPLSPFIGRDAEREALLDALGRERLVTLVGPGGSGKTRLALEAARERASSVGHPAWLVELATVDDGARVADVARRAIGVPDHASHDPVDAIAASLEGGPALLLIDNCEHVVVAAGVLVRRLLEQLPHLTVLATSRAPLGLTGEVVWPVPPLGVPPVGRPADGDLTTFDAIALFVDRARRSRPDFDATDDPDALVALVRGLDGLPLAIELAAAHARSTPVAQLVAGLYDRFGLLTAPGPVGTDGHGSLLASIEWSHDLLAPDEQLALRRLSVFAGAFDRDAATQVVADPGGTGIDAARVDRLLRRLVDVSLVHADLRGTDAPYSMLETIRAFGRERLAEAGELDGQRQRHLDWARRLVERAEQELVTSRQGEWLVRLDAVHGDLRQALAWSMASGRTDDGLRMAAGLSLFWKLGGHVGVARTILTEMLDVAPADADARLAVEWALADLLFWMGNFTASRERATAALAAARAAADDWYVGRSLWAIGNADAFGDEPLTGVASADAAREVAQRTGDVWLEGVSTQLGGLVYCWHGCPDEAAPYVEPALAIARAHDIPQLTVWSAALATAVAVWHGDFEAAERHDAVGRAASSTIADPASRAQLDQVHTGALLLRGRWAEAEAVLEADLAALRAAGIRAFVPPLQHRLVRARLATDPERAAEAGAIDPEQPEVVPAYEALRALGLAEVAVATGAGDVLAAVDLALLIARVWANPWVLTEVLCLRVLATAAHDPTDAAALADEALDIACRVGAAPLVPEAIDAVAVAQAGRGHAAEALRLIGAADAIREGMGTVPYPATAIGRSELLASAAVDDVDAALAAGRALSLEDAVVVARKRRGARGRPVAGWASLTPTEARVAELAGDGLTNPQIAERLFVSTNTVKTHLAHVFTKLTVANRTELAAALARREG